MPRVFTFAIVACCLSFSSIGPSQARDEKCLEAMQGRVQACTEDCVSKARAAVDPSIQDLIIGRACTKNCLKIEMFHGQSCS